MKKERNQESERKIKKECKKEKGGRTEKTDIRKKTRKEIDKKDNTAHKKKRNKEKCFLATLGNFDALNLTSLLDNLALEIRDRTSTVRLATTFSIYNKRAFFRYVNMSNSR